MSGAVSETGFPARRRLVVVLLLSVCLNTIGIRWGLPNDNNTWAADSFQPMAPMSIAKHGLWGEPWNSGWFYFKYPIGHPLMLMAAQAPYLAWLRVTGQLHTPKSTYPYGFARPERALTVLALLTRLVSVLMGVATVALACATATMLFGANAGVIAALLVTGCYPLVFYAHTANVDGPLLFWIALALAAAVRSADTGSAAMTALTGAAIAMALLTKEQSLGAIVAVPLVWSLRRHWGPGLERRVVWRHVLMAGTAFAAVTVLIGNVWWNPMGYVNRWRFLLGVLPAEVRDRYAPYQFQVQVPKGFSPSLEVTRFLKIGDTVAHALTVPVLCLCLLGVAWGLWRRPRPSLLMLLMLATYYVFSLRATALMQVRYTMPFLYGMLLFGGVAGGAIIDGLRLPAHRGARRLATASLGLVLVCAVVPGVEIARLLVRDPRYAAEAWLRQHAPAQARVEIYERQTYLPRLAADLQVIQVPVEGRTVAKFEERRPDLVILSSGGRAGLTGRYVRDWQPGKPIIADLDTAKEFFARLRSEQLGYRRVGHFQTAMWWIRPRINSLNPEITIFAREAVAGAVNG